MPVTTPWSVFFPDGSSPANLITLLTSLATSVRDAITNAVAQVKASSPSRVASQAARDTLFPGTPAAGSRVWRDDLGWEETYYAAYSSTTNVHGTTVAGWYPTAGATPMAMSKCYGIQTIAANAWALLNAAYGTPPYIKNVTLAGGAFTVGVAGWYRISVYMRLSNSTVPLAFQTLLNSTTIDSTAMIISDSTTDTGSILSGDVVMKLAAGDVIRNYVYSNGVSNNFSSPNFLNVAIDYLRPPVGPAFP